MSNFLASGSPLASLITATLEKDGTMQSVRASLKAQVFRQLSQVSRGKENSLSLSNLNKLNQVKSDERYGRSLSLVFDLLNSMGLHQTASLLKTEIGSPVEGSVSRSTLAMELGVSADNDELPLMFQVIDAINSIGSGCSSVRENLAVDTTQSAMESFPSKAQSVFASSQSLSPSQPESTSPATHDRGDIDFSRNSPRTADAKKSSPNSPLKSSSVDVLSSEKSVESTINESIDESIESIKSSPSLSPVKPTALSSLGSVSVSPRVDLDSSRGSFASASPAAKSTQALSPERKPLTPSSSPSKSPQTKVLPPKNNVQDENIKVDQNASEGKNEKDPYTNYQNVLDSEELKSATASRLSNDLANERVDNVREQSSRLLTSTASLFPSIDATERESRSLSLNSDDDAYHEAISKSLEEVPEEESPEESFATAGSYEDAELDHSVDDTNRMPLSSLTGREDVTAAKVKKVMVGKPTNDFEETGKSELGRANVTRLGSGGTSRLSRSNAGWNVVGRNSPVRDDGPDSFDLPASSRTSSPPEKSSSEPGSKRSSSRPNNTSSDADLENLSDSYELEELGHSEGSSSPSGSYTHCLLLCSFHIMINTLL